MGPLKDLKVLDFSTLLPGPYASMMLADMGAEVLRVESPTRVDLARVQPPMDGNASATHRHLNRSKRSLTLDLKRPEAIEIVKKLVADYDVVLEQFRPGVMDRLGIGYEALQAINPALIYCAITGYGQDGPFKNRPGHDNNYLSIAGMSSYSGLKESGPVPSGFQIADVAGGSLHAVIGILAALTHRNKCGEGQLVDISMTDAAFALNTIAGADYLIAGQMAGLESTLLNGGTFYDYYRTRDGRYFSVGSLEPQFLKLLCETLERPELIPLGATLMDPDRTKRQHGQQAFKTILKEIFSTRDFKEWCSIFAAVEACVEPVLTLAEAAEHPQLQAREMVVNLPTKTGNQKQAAHPIKYSRCNPEYRYAGADLGEHSTELLVSLGYSREQINALETEGVVTCARKH